MKTHIIHLDQDDNVVSITDKIAWGKAQRVLLIYPPSLDLKLQKIDFLLILRSAKKKGFSLALVSRVKNVKELAGELNIPVFRSIKNAQRRNWASSDSVIIDRSARQSSTDLRQIGLDAKPKGSKWKEQTGFRLFFFSMGVMAVLLISIIFIPSAVVHLDVTDKIQMENLEVTALDTIGIVNLSGVIPAYTLTIEVTGDRVVSVNTKTKIPDKYSVGVILFTNLTEGEIEIPLGTIITRLDNSGIRFETTQRGVVASGVGETLELPIRALTPGEVGNLEANSLGSLVGDLGASLSATNPESTFSGADRITNSPDQADRNGLFDMLEAELKIKAIQAAQDQLSEGVVIFPDTVKLENRLYEIYVPSAGQPGDRLALDLKLSYTLQYSTFTDLEKLGQATLNAGMPEGYVPLSESTIKFDLLSPPITNSLGGTTISFQVNQKIRKDISLIKISQLIQGASLEESYRILEEEFGEEIKPFVELSPSWWPWLPIVTLRIDITGLN
jgi:hypothetical protein